MKNKKSVFIGLMFILAALGMLLKGLGYLENYKLIKVILLGLLLYTSLDSLIKRNIFATIFPLALITIIFSKELGINQLSSWTIIMAAIFLSIGLSMIFKKTRMGTFDKKKNLGSQSYEEEDGVFNIEASFSETIKYLSSENFKSCYLDSNFASMRVYLDNVNFEEEASIHIDASFSTVELYVPRNWQLVMDNNLSFANIKEKGRNEGLSNKKLYIYGNISFAGLEITYI